MLKRNAPSQVEARKRAKDKATKVTTKPYSYTRTTSARRMVDLGVGLPDRVKITHKFSGSSTVTTSSTPNTEGFLNWQANGIYNIIGGNSAYYFDQLASLYSNYTVIGSRITIKVNGGTSLVRLALAREPASVAGTNSIERIASQANGQIILAAGGAPPATLSTTYSAKGVYGGSVVSDSSLLGTDSTNPSDGQEFTLAYSSPTGSLEFYYTVTIEYITVWENRKQVDQSQV